MADGTRPPPATPCARSRSHPDAQPSTPPPKRARIPKHFERHPIAGSAVAEVTRLLEALPWAEPAFANGPRAKDIDQRSRHFDLARFPAGPNSATLGRMAKTGERNAAVMRFAEAAALEAALRAALAGAVPGEAEHFHSIQVNRDACWAPHVDRNFRHSYIAGFGGYDARGGRLKFWRADPTRPRAAGADAGGEAPTLVDVKHAFVKFDGRADWHATEEWEGGPRYTAVFFNAGPHGKRMTREELEDYREQRMRASQAGLPFVRAPDGHEAGGARRRIIL